MLMTMRAYRPRPRALAYVVAAAHDAAHHHPDAEVRKQPGLRRPDDAGGQGLEHRDPGSPLPIGVQVHGGMGFIEETGAAQHLRDAKISTIYEGTTGIQANDLIGRKSEDRHRALLCRPRPVAGCRSREQRHRRRRRRAGAR
jgi:alkylation response protein AidB-like acyl-CoA dehydrogenase